MLEKHWKLVSLEAAVASMWSFPVWLWAKGPHGSPCACAAGTLRLPPRGQPQDAPEAPIRPAHGGVTFTLADAL